MAVIIRDAIFPVSSGKYDHVITRLTVLRKSTLKERAVKDLVVLRSLFCAHGLLALLLILPTAIIYVPVLLVMLCPGSNVEPQRLRYLWRCGTLASGVRLPKPSKLCQMGLWVRIHVFEHFCGFTAFGEGAHDVSA